MKDKFITLYHRSSVPMNIKEFMDREHVYGITPEEFLKVNKEVIFQQMNELAKYILFLKTGKWVMTPDDFTLDMPLPNPCFLRINSNKVTAELSIAQTNAQVVENDFYAFANDKIQELLQDEGYRLDSTVKRRLDVSVFGWFKSSYFFGTSMEDKGIGMRKGSWIEYSDLSKHVISLATSMTENGGSFTMKLPVISAESLGYIALGDNVQLAGNSFLGRAGKEDIRFNNSSEFFSKTELGHSDSNYFNWLISSNDLMFISFEKLEMEVNRDPFAFGDKDNFDIKSMISDGVFDMIALVDEVRVITDAATGNCYVEVTGRDLMKLIIEDGSFFFNPSTCSNPSRVFANAAEAGKQGDVREADQLNNNYNNPINRLRRVTGEVDIFANRINQDISYILKGVISQLANIEVVPSYVFDSWGNNRTKFVELQPVKKK